MTQPYYTDDTVTLHHGDALTVLAALPDASIDAVITDPPYEIGIAGRDWDSTGISYRTELWAQCLRVIKPGGHLVAFGAPRTYHRMVCAAEDAGWRVVDQLEWIYTHGKPKGTDLARAIDRRRDDREQVLQVTAWLAAARDAAGWTNARIDALWGFSGMGGLWTTQGKAAIVPTVEQWDRLRDALAGAARHPGRGPGPRPVRRLRHDVARRGRGGLPRGRNRAARAVLRDRRPPVAAAG